MDGWVKRVSSSVFDDDEREYLIRGKSEMKAYKEGKEGGIICPANGHLCMRQAVDKGHK